MLGRARGTAVAVALAVACGSGAEVAAPGSHCSETSSANEHWAPLHDVLTTGRWAEVVAVDPARRPEPAPAGMEWVRLDVGRVVDGSWPAEATVPVPVGTAAEAADELRSRARLLAGASVRPAADAPPTAAGLVSLRQDGSVRFLGGCADRVYAPAVEALHRRRGATGTPGTAADAVLAVVSEPDGPAARALLPDPPASTRWQDLAPDARALVDAPEEVLAGMRQVVVDVRLPAGWREADVVVCTRVAQGWNECTTTTAARGAIPLRSYVAAGEGLEVWVAERERGVRGPRERALEIPPDRLAGPRVVIHGSAGVDSAATAFAAARAGTAFRL